MKIKVLPLEGWMNMAIDSEEDKYEFTICHEGEIEHVFNRDGWYFNRENNTSWFEVNKKAYRNNVKDFNYMLSQYEYRNKPLRQTEYNALMILNKSGLLTKEQRGMLCDEYHRKHLREITTNTYKMIRTLNE